MGANVNLREGDVTVPGKMSEMRPPRPNRISKAVNLKASEVRELCKRKAKPVKWSSNFPIERYYHTADGIRR